MRSIWTLLALAGAATILVGSRPAGQATVQQWEYRTVWDQTDTTKLNVLGREGWELVAVHTAIFNGTTAKEVGWLYFKRPIKTT